MSKEIKKLKRKVHYMKNDIEYLSERFDRLDRKQRVTKRFFSRIVQVVLVSLVIFYMIIIIVGCFE